METVTLSQECLLCEKKLITNYEACHVCNDLMCHKCHQNAYMSEGWLIYELICGFCNQITCPNCLSTCYSCANEGQCEMLCDDCRQNQNKILRQSSCQDHTWPTCEKHSDLPIDYCGHYESNRNYALRHSI